MSDTRYFSEKDYNLPLQLQELFNETVYLQTKLERVEVENSKLKEERQELARKLKKAHNEIALLIKRMKFLLSDEDANKVLALFPISETKRVH